MKCEKAAKEIDLDIKQICQLENLSNITVKLKFVINWNYRQIINCFDQTINFTTNVCIIIKIFKKYKI
jgi:hypothetical protein